jgi:hydrogenase/urease accessory protein HupE
VIGRSASWLLAFGVALGANAPASAHESRPAYLELRATDATGYAVLWRRPALGEQVLSLQPVLPAHCVPVAERARFAQPDAFVERWQVDCGADGLVGRSIAIDGLPATFTDVLVRLALADGANHTRILRPENPGFIVPTQPSGLEVAGEYGRLGLEHILGGVDHLLFVLALLILVEGVRRLIATVTAFTLAHSLTLGAATIGWVHVPQPPVEAVIALSIALVASEILRARAGRAGITQRRPWIVAFAFGLLHGFGFAGALAEVGLPQNDIPLALLTFNAGVEIGQLLFIGAVLVLVATLRRTRIATPRWLEAVPPYAIGAVAMLWVFERIAAF